MSKVVDLTQYKFDKEIEELVKEINNAVENCHTEEAQEELKTILEEIIADCEEILGEKSNED